MDIDALKKQVADVEAKIALHVMNGDTAGCTRSHVELVAARADLDAALALDVEPEMVIEAAPAPAPVPDAPAAPAAEPHKE